MKLTRALEISDRPNDFTHNEQVIARITLARKLRTVRGMCDVWLDREPDCAGVRAILIELEDES